MNQILVELPTYLFIISVLFILFAIFVRIKYINERIAHVWPLKIPVRYTDINQNNMTVLLDFKEHEIILTFKKQFKPLLTAVKFNIKHFIRDAALAIFIDDNKVMVKFDEFSFKLDAVDETIHIIYLLYCFLTMTASELSNSGALKSIPSTFVLNNLEFLFIPNDQKVKETYKCNLTNSLQSIHQNSIVLYWKTLR